MGKLLIEIIDGLSIEGFLPPGVLNVAYSAQLRTFGARGAVRWSDVGDSLPDDFAIDDTTGLITGPAEEPGTWSITIRADDGSGVYTQRTFTLRVAALPLSASGMLGPWAVGTAVGGSVTISGGRAPFTIIASTMPTSVTLDLLDDTITPTGTPTAGHGVVAGDTGAFPASITVRDADLSTFTWTQEIEYSVPELSGAIASLPNASIGVPYVGSVTGAGGVPPLTFSLDTAPGWMAINGASGAISGTAELGDEAIDSLVVARLTDAEGNAATDADTLDVVNPLTITGAFPTSVAADQVIDWTLPITGGSGTYSSVAVETGAKPSWMTLAISGSNVRATGTAPNASATSNFTVRVTDNVGSYGVSSAQAVTVVAYATFNPSYLTTGAALSEANTRLQYSSGGGVYRSSRSNMTITGKRYFNIRVEPDAGGSVISGGVSKASQNLVPDSNWLGEGSSVGWWGPSDVVYSGGVGVSGSVPYLGGVQLMDLAVDATTTTSIKVWIRPTGGAWIGGGNPATGSTPTFTLTGAGAVYAASTMSAGTGSTSSRHAKLIAKPSSVTGTVPSGFTAGITS